MKKNMKLENCHVYGFDYDYRLVHYSANLQSLIYELANEHWVNEVCISLMLLYCAFSFYGAYC